MPDVISAGEIAVHPVELAGSAADVGADIVDLIIGERAYAAVGIDRGFKGA